MNEEIFKRLQDQCWIYPTHPDMIDTDSNGEVRPCGFDTKKFFKLTVLECARLAMTQHYSTSPAEYDDMEPYQQGCDDTASFISGLIRRTFGVEE